MGKRGHKQVKPTGLEEESIGGHSQLVGFIGGYLIDQGTLTLQQLDEALLFQLRKAEAGEPMSLADVLLQLEFASRADIARAERRLNSDRAARG